METDQMPYEDLLQMATGLACGVIVVTYITALQ